MKSKSYLMFFIIFISILTFLSSSCKEKSETITKELDLSNYCTKVRLHDNVELALYTDTIFRLRISQLEGERFPYIYEIPFVIGKLENWPQVSYREWKDSHFTYIETERIQIRFSRGDFSWEVFTTGGKKQIYPSDGPIYGMFRDGYTVFDSASAFEERNINSRFAHWFYNPETGRYVDAYLEDDLILDKYFIYGPGYETLFAQFNELVGSEPLLPKKAYGFFQTQHLACEGNQEKLMEVARTFRSRDIPCDYLIIDFEWGDGCDGNKEVRWGSRLNWSQNYSEPRSPEEMITELKNMHFDVMLIHHNAPNFNGRTEQGWTESIYDKETWWTQIKKELDIGVRGTWQDTRRNDITDSVIWQGIQGYFGPSRRVLFMGCRKMQEVNPWETTRNTIPINQIIGARRYPFDWTGDADYTWAELKWQIRAITNTHGSMKGVTYVTNDSYGADWKIQARWNQFIDFNSLSRSHNLKPWGESSNIEDWKQKIKIAREKEEGESVSPSSSGAESANGQTAEASIRKHRKLRYQLLPYIYSAAFVNYLTGLPICRPLLLAFPDDPNCSADQWPYQYMFGENLLVAPVYADMSAMDIYLPSGADWVDYWSKDIHKGGRVIKYDTSDINKLPFFVRSGTIIPMREETYWIESSIPENPLILDVYPSEKLSLAFVLYEDDGVSTYYQKGAFSQTRLECQKKPSGDLYMNIGRMEGDYSGKPEKRKYICQVNFCEALPKYVSCDGRKLSRMDNQGFISSGDEGWYFDRENRILRIQIWQRAFKEVKIEIMKQNNIGSSKVKPRMNPESKNSDDIPKKLDYKIINTYPHSRTAFTQGLAFDSGFLYEGTGQFGFSTLRKVKLDTGETLQVYKLPGHIFGEGISIFQDKIIQLTWRALKGFVYDKESFRLLRIFKYPLPIEGWGITTDGKDLVMSDGTHRLYFLDPESFKLRKRLEVFDNKGPVRNINELEFIEGVIFANVWQSENIIRIDPETGKVTGVLNLEKIAPQEYRGHVDYVLNGIAFDPGKRRIFVTGKMWPKIYEIEIIE